MAICKYVTFAVASAALITAPLQARNAASLSDLVGARAGQAEGELEARGFTYITGHKGHSSSHTYWWDDRDDNCVHVKTSDGRYTSITDASRSDCNRGGDGDLGTALAVGAGVALLGALLSGGGHKKGHHDDDRHLSSQEQDDLFDSGFYDGKNRLPFHNPRNSDAYTSGYDAGVEQHSRDTSYHSGRGGYRAAYFGDLAGRDSIRAIDAMNERGFRDVDSFSSGSTQYGIFWKADSRQCVQMTMADGRVVDVRDIGRNPNCR